MYQVNAIGEIKLHLNQISIQLDEDYRKGLLHAETFSHMHLVYGNFAFGETKKDYELRHMIIKVEGIRKKEGIVIGSRLHDNAKECKQIVSDSMLNDNANECEQVRVLFDMKPYFPCEDRVVKLEEVQKEGFSQWNQECGEIQDFTGHDEQDIRTLNIALEASESDEKSMFQQNVSRRIASMEPSFSDSILSKYLISMCGKIRVQEGDTYIECSKELAHTVQTGEVVRVFWWFHRFDKSNYRKVTECDPPYESAPRVGIFASRSPVRPNPIAMTTARVIYVDEKLGRIYVNALDCFDQTPCINVVPYITELDYVPDVEVGEWVRHWPKEWVEEEALELYQSGIEISLEQFLAIRSNPSHEVQNHMNSLQKQIEDTNISKQPSLNVYEAYENNLKGINVSIPYHKMTALVGVSGSGKSSLAFDTIYAECQRRFADLQGNQDVLPKPKISRMTGVIPAIAISQHVIGKNTRSTVGTYSNLYEELRLIFSTIGVRHCPNCGKVIAPMTVEEMMGLFQPDEVVEVYNLEKNLVQGKNLRARLEQALEESHGACYVNVADQMVLLQTRQMCYHCNHMMFHLTPATFNYNDSESNCKRCHGRGAIVEINEETIIQDAKKSLLDDASIWYKGLREFQKHPNANWMRGEVLGLAQKYGIDLELPYEELPEEFKDQLLHGTGEETVTFEYVNDKNGRNGSICRPVEGAIHAIKRFYTENGDVYPINQLVRHTTCPICDGERLGKEARLVTVGQIRYPQVAQMTFSELNQWCRSLCEHLSDTGYAKVDTAIVSIVRVCEVAKKLGIEYLSLNRDTLTLSGGEKKRLKLLSNLATSISGILYILDEPTAGLNEKDYDLLIELLHTIIDRGNTILMVEHNAKMIKEADQVIEIGPGAGIHGGEIVSNGEIVSSLTKLPTRFLPVNKNIDFMGGLQFHKISYRNLKEVSFTIPLHGITCIHGVSGSGKSSMVEGVIYQEVLKNPKPFHQVCYVSQQPIGRNVRSTPATYLKLMDEIRKIYGNSEQAKRLGLTDTAFSYNSVAGQCDCCKGIGKVNPEFMSDVWVTCPVCGGTRYKKQVLEVTYEGYTIAQVLEFSIEKAREVFHNERKLKPVLDLLCEASLGYLIMGQSTTTLSGGEAQRLKLVNELMTQTKSNTLYLLDEPTSGLSQKEVVELLKLFHRLVEENNTIVLIEHNEEVLLNCDYQIELGPKAGDEGGRIVSQGCVKIKM